MGRGRSNKGPVGGALIVRTTKLDLSTVVKKYGLPSLEIARMAAEFHKLKEGSAEKAVMKVLIRNRSEGRGGMSLGAIRLRTKDFGLPRDKLLDLAHVFKPLADHGLINTVVGLNGDTRYTTQLNQQYVQAAATIPSDVLDALSSIGKNR